MKHLNVQQQRKCLNAAGSYEFPINSVIIYCFYLETKLFTFTELHSNKTDGQNMIETLEFPRLYFFKNFFEFLYSLGPIINKLSLQNDWKCLHLICFSLLTWGMYYFPLAIPVYRFVGFLLVKSNKISMFYRWDKGLPFWYPSSIKLWTQIKQQFSCQERDDFD
jgi:hypothetical protein